MAAIFPRACRGRSGLQRAQVCVVACDPAHARRRGRCRLRGSSGKIRKSGNKAPAFSRAVGKRHPLSREPANTHPAAIRPYRAPLLRAVGGSFLSVPSTSSLPAARRAQAAARLHNRTTRPQKPATAWPLHGRTPHPSPRPVSSHSKALEHNSLCMHWAYRARGICSSQEPLR